MAALTDLLNKIPKPIRDAAEIAIAALAVAIADYLTGVIDANPTAFGVWTGVVVVAIGMFRRWLAPAPTPQLALFSPSFSSFDDNGLDRPTPALGTPTVLEFAPRTAEQTISRDDDDFISDCVATIPQPGNGVKSFSPAVLASILICLFQHRADIMALIENAKTAWLKFWALWQLRSAIRVAIKSKAGVNIHEAFDHPQIQPIEKWLLKADTPTLIRFGRIAAMRPRA